MFKKFKVKSYIFNKSMIWKIIGNLCIWFFFSKQYIDKQNTKIFGWPFAVCKEEKKQQTEWIAFFTFFLQEHDMKNSE